MIFCRSMREISGTGSRAKTRSGPDQNAPLKTATASPWRRSEVFTSDAVKRLRKRKRTTSNNSQQKAPAFRWLANCNRPRRFCSHSLSLSHAMENSSEYHVIGAMKMKNSFESQLKITERL